MAGTPDTGLQCLALVARHHGIDLSPERLMHDHALDGSAVAARQLLRMAKDAGLRAKHTPLNWGALTKLGAAYPVLARLQNGNWVVIAGIVEGKDGTLVRVLDPLAVRPEMLLLDEARLARVWDGTAILVKRSHGILDENQPFGLRWFIPEIVLQRRLFRDVALAAIVL